MTDAAIEEAGDGFCCAVGCFLLLVGASFAGGAWALGRSQGWW